MSQESAPQDKRDQQVGVLLSKAEKAAVKQVADDLGMSMSNAGRYLINRGLAALHPKDSDQGE